MHGALLDVLTFLATAVVVSLRAVVSWRQPLLIPPYFFLFAMVFLGPLRVRALVLER